MRSLKKHLRHRLRTRRKETSVLFQTQCAHTITRTLLQQSWFQCAKHIALYTSFDGEVPTEGLLQQALQLGKYCYLPTLVGRHLHFAPIDAQTSLTPNRYGILEPVTSTPLLSGNDLDLVLMPLVAFDLKGYRLGMGGGYYDRTFQKKGGRPILVGLAYDFQKVSFVPHTGLDIKLHAVVTERQLYLLEPL